MKSARNILMLWIIASAMIALLVLRMDATTKTAVLEVNEYSQSHVEITIRNNGMGRIDLFDTSCRGGYETISFDMMDQDGALYHVWREWQVFTVNFESVLTIEPGGSTDLTLDLLDGTWSIRGVRDQGDKDISEFSPSAVKAYYRPTGEKRTGAKILNRRIESEWQRGEEQPTAQSMSTAFEGSDAREID